MALVPYLSVQPGIKHVIIVSGFKVSEVLCANMPHLVDLFPVPSTVKYMKYNQLSEQVNVLLL